MLLDRSRSRFLFSKRLRRLGTRHRGDIHNSVFPFALIFAAYNLPKVLFFEYLQEIIQQGLTTTRNSSVKRYVPSVKKISGFTQKLRKTGSRVVALQLCSPLQFGPLSYQPREWGFISSNQSALWSCLLHVTSQLGEGCSMTFVRFVFLILWKTCVWNSFGAFSPMGFWRILQKFEVCSKLSSVNAYVHMLES